MSPGRINSRPSAGEEAEGGGAFSMQATSSAPQASFFTLHVLSAVLASWQDVVGVAASQTPLRLTLTGKIQGHTLSSSCRTHFSALLLDRCIFSSDDSNWLKTLVQSGGGGKQSISLVGRSRGTSQGACGHSCPVQSARHPEAFPRSLPQQPQWVGTLHLTQVAYLPSPPFPSAFPSDLTAFLPTCPCLLRRAASPRTYGS